jgi:fluoride exporter
MPAVTWPHVLAVAGGSAAGGLVRWLTGLAFNALWQGFPLGTLIVNCVGGLLIGAALAWFEVSPSEMLRLLLVTGFLGGFTTFSAFTAESLLLLQRGDWLLAAAHTLSHVLGALVFAAIGLVLGRIAWP